jgi:hypothetical protein
LFRKKLASDAGQNRRWRWIRNGEVIKMAAVFDGKTKVGRAVADPGTDDTLPNPGSMAYGAIATPVSLSGTIGAHSMLVHGDRWQQIDGNFTESVGSDLRTTISGNQTHTTQGNQTVTVSGDHNETVMGNTMQTMIGPQIVSNMDVRNETRAVTHVHTHGDNFFQYDPNAKFQVHDLDMQATLEFMFEAELEHTEIAYHHLEAKVAHNYFAAIDSSTCATRFQNQAMNEDVAISWGTIRLLQQHISALQNETEMLKVDLILTEIEAGLHRSMGIAP